jgi:uncharacterized protein YndB with AHSA1/START domain
MRARYALTTEWVLATSIERVWDALVEPQTWPRWWPYIETVAVSMRGDADGVGAIHRCTWSTRLPYRLVFDMTTTRIEPRTAIDGVVAGDVEGTGQWRLREAPGSVRVRYAWNVATRAPWMNALAPLLAPLFVWNHDQVMAAGARGLARDLGVPLVAHRRIGRAGSTTRQEAER